MDLPTLSEAISSYNIEIDSSNPATNLLPPMAEAQQASAIKTARVAQKSLSVVRDQPFTTITVSGSAIPDIYGYQGEDRPETLIITKYRHKDIEVLFGEQGVPEEIQKAVNIGLSSMEVISDGKDKVAVLGKDKDGKAVKVPDELKQKITEHLVKKEVRFAVGPAQSHVLPDEMKAKKNDPELEAIFDQIDRNMYNAKRNLLSDYQSFRY